MDSAIAYSQSSQGQGQDPKCGGREEKGRVKAQAGVSTLCENPLISTLLRASSHMSQELSFHT